MKLVTKLKSKITDFTALINHKKTNPFLLEISVKPEALNDFRKECRVRIRTYNQAKDLEKLESVLNNFYQAACLVNALYGQHSCNTKVPDFHLQVAGFLQKKIASRIQFSFKEHGYLETGRYLTKNDYNLFVQVFGKTRKKIDLLSLFQEDFDQAIETLEKLRKKEFGEYYIPMDEEIIEVMHKTRYGLLSK